MVILKKYKYKWFCRSKKPLLEFRPLLFVFFQCIVDSLQGDREWMTPYSQLFRIQQRTKQKAEINFQAVGQLY